MTKSETKQLILNELTVLTSSAISAFNKVQRATLTICVARAGRIERHGDGMPRFNDAIKELIADGIVIRHTKGKNTYYSLPQAI